MEFKAAGKVTVARQAKYLVILRLIVQKSSLKDKDFKTLTKDDVISLSHK